MQYQKTFTSLDRGWTNFFLYRNHAQLENAPTKRPLERGWQVFFSAVAPTMTQKTQLDRLANRDNPKSVIAQVESLYRQSGIVVGVSALSPTTADVSSEYGSAAIPKSGNYHVHGYVGGFDTTSRIDVHGHSWTLREDVRNSLRVAGFWEGTINVQPFDAQRARESHYLATNLTDYERRDIRYEDANFGYSWGASPDEMLRFSRKARMAAGLL